MSADLVTVVGELVQVRMLRAVSGYGRRGDLVEVGIDTAAGLMEARLAEYVQVSGFVGVVGEVPGGQAEGASEPRRGKGTRGAGRKTRGGDGDQVDAEPGEGADAG